MTDLTINGRRDVFSLSALRADEHLDRINESTFAVVRTVDVESEAGVTRATPGDLLVQTSSGRVFVAGPIRHAIEAPLHEEDSGALSARPA